jgi:2-polyprenyl-3-methyl-5-hydroxy-6-metoxy-1,4-benzoquinol methylase
MIQSERQDIKQKFDSEQPRWEAIYHKADYDSKGFQWRQEGAVTLCARHVPPEGRVLDLGCGCGNASMTLAKLGFRVLGVDISEPMIAQASDNAARIGVDNCQFEVYDVVREHPDAGQFDAVVALGFIEYFDEPILVLRRIHHLLRRNGVAMVQIWNRRPWSDTALAPMYRSVRAIGHPVDSLKDLAKTILPKAMVRRLQRGVPKSPVRTEPSHRRYLPLELHAMAQEAGFQVIDARASRYFPYHFFFSDERRIRWDEQLQKWAGHRKFARMGAIDYIAALKKV